MVCLRSSDNSTYYNDEDNNDYLPPLILRDDSESNVESDTDSDKEDKHVYYDRDMNFNPESDSYDDENIPSSIIIIEPIEDTIDTDIEDGMTSFCYPDDSDNTSETNDEEDELNNESKSSTKYKDNKLWSSLKQDI